MSGFVHSHQYSNEHYAHIHASQPQQYVFKFVTSPYPDTAPSTPEFIDTPSPSPSSSSSRSDEFSSTNDSSRKKNRIPRPLNCYFIFRKDVVDKNLIPKGAEHDSRHLSRIIGQLWKNLSEDEKAHYYRRALEERKRHEELYPDYVYQPQRRATEIKKRNFQRKSKDHINRAKDIAHLMSAGMTGSDLEDAVRNMPPIPKTPQVQPPKKRVSQQQARSPIHAQPTVPKPYMCKTEATEHQFNSSTLPMNSHGEGHFFSAVASFEMEYMVHFEIPTNGYFDNQSPLSEINYCLAMSSGIYDNTAEFHSTYDSSYPTTNAPHIF
ncbi:hypothetical protein ARMGADRAFT_1018535 [Armillaria gallica]|uniref:HMG box domain-containing protein n=1 Tax=Armillaria gallica TaxID=47427 RepID=A0A2H3CYZ7_ARMGA|nr:hypothetical protein ARMGADRAFT_1018535 [Armillaria gallica]